MSTRAYYVYNRTLMRILFAIPLTCIAVYEAYLDPRHNKLTKAWLEPNEETDEDNPECQNPHVDDEDGMEISKVPFDDLVKAFPNTGIVRDILIAHRSDGL